MDFFKKKLRQREETACARVWADVVMWKFANAKHDNEKTTVGVTAANICQGKHGPMLPYPSQVEKELRARIDFPADRDVTMTYDNEAIYASIVFTKK